MNPNYIVISGAQCSEIVRTNEILYCKADGNYSVLYLTGDNKITSAINLHWLELRLCCMTFFRVHRSYMVNVSFIRKIFKDRHKLLLESGKEIPISRNNIKPLEKRFYDLNKLNATD